MLSSVLQTPACCPWSDQPLGSASGPTSPFFFYVSFLVSCLTLRYPSPGLPKGLPRAASACETTDPTVTTGPHRSSFPPSWICSGRGTWSQSSVLGWEDMGLVIMHLRNACLHPQTEASMCQAGIMGIGYRLAEQEHLGFSVPRECRAILAPRSVRPAPCHPQAPPDSI